MAGQTPIWKKEFRLRSKPPKAAAEAQVDTHKQPSASIWKKDLTLRSGKSKEKQAVEAAATSEIEAAPGHGSMWKRELRIRRSVPKSHPSSELDSMLAHAVDVEPVPIDLGSRESDDSSAETNDEVSSPAQPKAFVLVERADAAEEMPHRWAARAVETSELDDVIVEETTTELEEEVPLSPKTVGPENLSGDREPLAEEPPEHTHLSYGVSVPLSPIASPAEEDAPLDDQVRGAQPGWAWDSTSAADEPRHLDPNVIDPAAGAAELSAVEAPGFGSEEEPEAPARFALHADETFAPETGEEAEPQAGDIDSNFEYSDLGASAAFWSSTGTPGLSDPADSDQQNPDSVAQEVSGEVDAYIAPYVPSYLPLVTDEPEEAGAIPDEEDSVSTFEETELPFARADSTLESSDGDSASAGYRGLGFVPESTEIASWPEHATVVDEHDEQVILPEPTTSDWLTVPGGEEVPPTSPPGAIDADPGHDSPETQGGPDMPVNPVPYLIPGAPNDGSDELGANSEQTDEATKTKEPKKSKFRREIKRGARESGTATRASTAEVVGVRIGSSQIVAAVVRNTPGVPELVTLVKAPIEPGIVVAGEVREPDALALELKTLFTKNKLPRKRIRLGIASSRVGVRIIEVPALQDPKALENAIRFRAQEVVSVPLSDAILDHFVVGDTELDGAPAFRVLLAFAHRDLVDRYVEAFKKARLKVASVDFEAFALLRAVTSPEDRENADRATVALAVGQERTIFAVAEGDVCDFTRVLEWGGGSLTVAVARALNMTPSQAEPVKRTLSFGEELEHPDLDQTQLDAARAAMQRELQVLARELLTSLQFYQSRPGSLAIGEVLITGGGIELEGTAQELQERLGVPVRLVDPFERVRTGKKAKVTIEPGATTIAIGLGLEA
jgi:type IV pilus assembly protein PilM